MKMSPIDKVYADIPIKALLRNGTVATLTGIDVAVVPPAQKPGRDTAWTHMTVTAGVATVLLAGPRADSTGAVTVPGSGWSLWIRLLDNPEVQAVKVDDLTVS